MQSSPARSASTWAWCCSTRSISSLRRPSIPDIAFGPKNMGLSEDEIRRARASRGRALSGSPRRSCEKSPFDLSGGQKRRAAIAGVIAMEPDVLILDEPTAGLDPAGRESILAEYPRLSGRAACGRRHGQPLDGGDRLQRRPPHRHGQGDGRDERRTRRGLLPRGGARRRWVWTCPAGDAACCCSCSSSAWTSRPSAYTVEQAAEPARAAC